MPVNPPLRLVVLVSGSGSNLQAIMDRIAAGELRAETVAVISDRPEAYGLERARKAGVPAIAVSPEAHSDTDAFFAALQAQIDHYRPDLVVLAGFMRILPAAFVAAYAGRIMNIHPSLLPAYRGLNTHQRVLDAGEKRHGATVHFVVPELDAGPIIEQAVVEVLPDDDADRLARRVLEQEHVIYARAIGRYAAGELDSMAAESAADA